MDKRTGYSIAPPPKPNEYILKDKITGELTVTTLFTPPDQSRYEVIKKTMDGGISCNIFINEMLEEYLNEL